MIPKLNGLVLAGGKSRRMGVAKDLLKWYGREQRYVAADLLNLYCDEVFISCRQDQLANVDGSYTALPDLFLNIGPLGGILSALCAQNDKAWLVVACDMPLLDRNAIEFLIANRCTGKLATAYECPFDTLPEPLLAIWEPKSHPLLLHALNVGNRSLRKVFINHGGHVLKPPNPHVLMNVNTPDDAERLNEILQKRNTKHLL